MRWKIRLTEEMSKLLVKKIIAGGVLGSIMLAGLTLAAWMIPVFIEVFPQFLWRALNFYR